MLKAQDFISIHQLIAPFIGERLYRVAVGFGNTITLDFGKPISDKSGRGEWSIWGYSCAWHLQLESSVKVASEDPREQVETITSNLQGIIVDEVIINPPAFDASVNFSNEVILRLFPINTSSSTMSEHWMLFTPDFHVLAFGPGSNWSYSKVSKL